MGRTLLACCLVFIIFLGLAHSSAGAESPDTQAQIDELKRLVIEQSRQLAEQQRQIEQLRQTRTDSRFAEVHREELTALMKEILDDAKAVPALPAWLENLTFSGDLRLRYEYRNENHRYVPGGPTPKDDSRFRFRLRFGFAKTWWEKQMELVVRLTSATSVTDPNTGEQDGNWASQNGEFTNNWSKKPIWIDLVYIKYAPKDVEGLVVLAGKMPLPWTSATSLLWEPTLTPEGIYAKYDAPAWGPVKPYVEAGWFMLQLNASRAVAAVDGVGQENTSRDVMMFSTGAGLTWEIAKQVKAFLGANYYNYVNFNTDVPSTSAGAYGPDGTWRRPDYGLIEVTSRLTWEMFGLPWTVWSSWVHNCRDTYDGVDNDLYEASNAYGGGLQVGRSKKKGDWTAGYYYMYQEAFSQPVAFSDATFGGPNRQGHVITGKYLLDDFLSLGVNLYLTQPIHAYRTEYQRDQRTLLQVEVIWQY